MSHPFSTKQRNGLIGGAALILIGLLVFVAQFAQTEALGWLITGGLALIFLGWGILTRESGFLIPAGILGGVAAGIFLILNTGAALSGAQSGALMVSSLAVGFASISVLSMLFTRTLHGWALIVAAILGAVGIALWVGGPALNLLQLAGQLWPLILVAIGIGILWRVLRGKSDVPSSPSEK